MGYAVSKSYRVATSAQGGVEGVRGLSSGTSEFGLTDCLRDMLVAGESVWPMLIFHLQLMIAISF